VARTGAAAALRAAVTHTRPATVFGAATTRTRLSTAPHRTAPRRVPERPSARTAAFRPPATLLRASAGPPSHPPPTPSARFPPAVRGRRPTRWFPTTHGWSRWTPTGRWPPTTTVGRPRPQRSRRRTPPAVLSRPPAAPPATQEEERLRLWVRGVRRDRPGRAR